MKDDSGIMQYTYPKTEQVKGGAMISKVDLSEVERVTALNQPHMTVCERYHCKLSVSACVKRILRAHRCRQRYHGAMPLGGKVDMFCLKCDQGERNLGGYGIKLSDISKWH